MKREAVARRKLVIWGIVSLVFLAGCGGGYAPQGNPVPSGPPATLTSLSPSSATAGGPSFTLTLTGTNFVSGAKLSWNNGAFQATTFVSSTQLTFQVPSSLIPSASANIPVTVQNPDGILSNALTFSIVNPVPTITSLSPLGITAGAAPFTLTVNGPQFVSGAIVQWNGTGRQTTFASSTQLTIAVPAGDVATAGAVQVTVINPAPGGGPSSPATFTINPLVSNPTPSLVSIAPSSSVAGVTGFTLTVNGSNFVAATVLQWNAANRSALVLSSTQLQAGLFPGDTAAAGAAQVSVANPGPGGGTSNPLGFTINAAPASGAGVVDRPSVTANFLEANAGSSEASLSDDGRFVAFTSKASNLVAGATNLLSDIFLHDTCIGAPPGCMPSTARVSVANDGSQANGQSFNPAISANGRFVAFASDATNLVTGDTNSFTDIFVRDTCFGGPVGCQPSTVRVSVDNAGKEFLLPSSTPATSADGRFVAFQTGFLPYYSAGNANIFVRDTCFGAPAGCQPATSQVDLATDGSPPNLSASSSPSISSTGRFVTFQSDASNLVTGDTNNRTDVFVRDTCFGAPTGCKPSTTRVSVASDGSQSNDFSFNTAISGDGRLISFASAATNLVANDTNGFVDVFVHDTCVGAPSGCMPSTARVSVDSAGNQANGASSNPSITADGRFVAFQSDASNLVTGDTNNQTDVLVHDTCFGATASCTPSTVGVSVALGGPQGNKGSFGPSPITTNGRFVAFESDATNLVPGDTNNARDIFLARTGYNLSSVGPQPSPAASRYSTSPGKPGQADRGTKATSSAVSSHGSRK